VFTHTHGPRYIIDVGLNFRTGIVTVSDAPEVILDGWEIARRYIRGSFIIDFASSVPIDHVSVLMKGGTMPALTL
jgi:hypothetical protein